MKRLEQSQGKHSKQSNHELSGITPAWKKQEQTSSSSSSSSSIRGSYGPNRMVSFRPPRPWPKFLIPGALVSLDLASPPGVRSTESASGRLSKFQAKSFNPLRNTSLRVPQCKHMIFVYIYICLKTPLEFKTPSCSNGIRNWKLLSAW